MAGPWEKFSPTESGPWDRFGGTEAGPWDRFSAAPQEYKREPIPAALPEDPAERAALRVRRTVSTPRDPESPLATAPKRIGAEAERLGKVSHDLLTGELEPTPDVILPTASAVVTPAARGVVAAAKTAAEATLPRFAEGGLKGRVAERLAEVPYAGTPIREAAAKAEVDFAERAIEAIKRPTGALPSQARAGKTVAEAIQAEKARTPASGTYEQRVVLDESKPRIVQAEIPTDLPPRLRYIDKALDRGMKEESIPGHLIDLAGTGKAADINALGRIRANVTHAEWPEVQGAVLAKMGEVGKEGFSATQMLRNFEGLSPGGKNLLFGDSRAAGTLRNHIESLVADARRMEAIARIPERATVPGTTGVALLAATSPMTALGTIVGGRVLANWLARPASAASLAAWSRAYTKFMAEGGTPASVAALKIATNNLNNTTGSNVTPGKIAKGISVKPPGFTEQDLDEMKRAPGAAGTDPTYDKLVWGELANIVRVTQKMAPRGLPVEKYRPTTNIEVRPEGGGPPLAEQLKTVESDPTYWLRTRFEQLGSPLARQLGSGDIDRPRTQSARMEPVGPRSDRFELPPPMPRPKPKEKRK